MSHVFVSYVREDADAVDRLVFQMRSAGAQVWLDRDSIQPGARWKDAIRAAIEGGAFFVACFSKSYSDRACTYMNEELALAIEELRLRPRMRAWFLPLLLDDSEAPDLPIGPGETLGDVQTLRLDGAWEDGIHRLISVIVPHSPRLSTVQDGASLRTALRSIASHQSGAAHLRNDLIRIRRTTELSTATLDELGVTLLSVARDTAAVAEILAWPEFLELPRSVAQLMSTPAAFALEALSEATSRRPHPERPSSSGNAFAVLSGNAEIFLAFATHSLDEFERLVASYKAQKSDSEYPPLTHPHHLIYVLGLAARAFAIQSGSSGLAELGERLLLRALREDFGFHYSWLIHRVVLSHLSTMQPTSATVNALLHQLDTDKRPYAVVALERLGRHQDDSTLASVLSEQGSNSDLVAGVVLARRKVSGPIAPLLDKYGFSQEELAALALPEESLVLKPITKYLVSGHEERWKLFENLLYRIVNPVRTYASNILYRETKSLWDE
jgi:hypothetical protein